MLPSPHRAIACSFESDAVEIERAADGALRYFRGQGPSRREYSYQRPFILELEITRRCNLRCVHCYAHAVDAPMRGELTRAEISTVLRDAQAIGIEELSLTGGEVLLHPHFLDIIDEGLSRAMNIRFVTNGTLLDDALLAALCERPIKLITVSLDAATAPVHDGIRGLGSHARALAAIDRLAEAGFKVSVITAFSTLNLAEFDALLALCIERRLDWQVQMTSTKGRCPQRITLTPEQYYTLGERVAEAMATRLPIHVIPMDDLATPSLFSPLNQIFHTWQGRCTGGLLNLFVRANGEVTPCSALAFPQSVVGDLRRESLQDICAEERCRAVLAWADGSTLSGGCGGCRFGERCRGGCPEILLSMCEGRTDNAYCYYRVEQDRILAETL